MTRRNLFPLVTLFGVVLGLQVSARADIFLELTDGGGSDTGLIVNNVSPNQSTFSGTVGVFSVVVAFDTSNSPGTASLGTLNIHSIEVQLVPGTKTGSHTLTVYAKSTDYNLPAGS